MGRLILVHAYVAPLLGALGVTLLTPLQLYAQSARPIIEWRVENPFRLFLDPSDSEQFRQSYLGLSGLEQRQPILSVERKLADQAASGWSEALYQKTCWSKAQLHYACADKTPYADPHSHRVVASLAGPHRIEGKCTWTVQVAGGAARSQQAGLRACRDHVELDIPYPAGAVVVVSQEGREVQRTVIKVKDVFIVGLGDSFASGDGNPDRPVRFDDLRSVSYRGGPGGKLVGYPARDGTWTTMRSASFAEAAAGWVDTPCRRSLYGHQLRAALQLAIEDPHRAVTFATFACWGAQIIRGVLLPQASSELQPGLSPRSQISDAAILQCGGYATEQKQWARAFERGGLLPALADLSVPVCPTSLARPIDLIFLSVGGNDVGFTQLVADAILSRDVPFRQLGSFTGQILAAEDVQLQLPVLREKFFALNRALRLVLHVSWSRSKTIVLVGYPPISLRDDISDSCPAGRNGMTVIPGFSLDGAKAKAAERVAAQLHQTMAASARQLGWTFVDSFRNEFARRGYCAGTLGALANPADESRLPRLINGQWHPYAPSQWQPYASRMRWIRSPNDGYLTTNFHVSDLDLSPINLILASSFSGSFHPTAEGQAAIADAVVEKARELLR